MIRTLVVAASLAVVVLRASGADACGGCFVPTNTNTIVTDHRMVLSVSPQASTLYDQIRYQGDPASFAWVLPIRGPATVGISSDDLFTALDTLTATRVVPPPSNCPPPPSCEGDRGAFSPAGAEGAADAGGVTVHRRETVGPYETVQLAATDADALRTWLDQNGFVLPEDARSIVGDYVAAGFDFLAMKLLPGAGVTAMRPVRITTAGASAALPLRMVAAGTGANVGITLWVVAQGRYEPENFPTFQIRDEELAWDWTRNASTYAELRAAKTQATGGRGWELESSTIHDPQIVSTYVRNGGFAFPMGPRGSGYEPVVEDGGVTQSADEARTEDMNVLFTGMANELVRVTRLRADLAKAALGEDLRLTATQDQTQVSTLRRPAAEIGEPRCPIYDACRQVGTLPRDEAVRYAADHGYGARSRGGCTVAPSAARRGLGALASSLAVAALFRFRRRRSR